MRPPEADRRLDDHRQVSLAGLGLRQLARDLSCPVVAISSVNRQSYDKAPSLDAFKGSGDLEYDADACLLLRLAARSDEEARAAQIGNNRGGVSGWAGFDRVYGICVSVDGVPGP
ncbi:MAG: DnaB-like helicase C-terminal domain-containing protein [Acidimicrobiia bacterium]